MRAPTKRLNEAIETNHEPDSQTLAMYGDSDAFAPRVRSNIKRPAPTQKADRNTITVPSLSR